MYNKIYLKSRSFIGSSATPPLDSETPEKILDRRLSKDKKSVHKSSDKVDGIKKLDPILEERSRRNSKREHTPSPQHKNNYKSNDKESTSSSSDSDDDSSSSSSDSSESEPEPKRSKKRKRRSSSSSHSRKKYKKERTRKDKYKSHDRHYKNDEYDRYSSKKKDVYQEKHKSSRSSKDYDRQRYRDGSEEERGRKRAKRSPSPRRRDHDKYDRYERSRDPRRSRSTSYSRHRRWTSGYKHCRLYFYLIIITVNTLCNKDQKFLTFHIHYYNNDVWMWNIQFEKKEGNWIKKY